VLGVPVLSVVVKKIIQLPQTPIAARITLKKLFGYREENTSPQWL